MKLCRLVDRYITHRRSLGERCQTNASILRAFCRGLRRDIDLKQVGVRQTTKFLYGKGPVTSAWHVKHNALKGFFRYVISREYGAKMPLPVVIPQRPPPFVAYIYSRKELRHLLQATKTYQRNCSCMESETMRVIVLLLYATGLRVREAVALNRTDVDFDQSLLTVVKSKFYKSRLVPFSPRLGHVLQGYLSRPTGLGPNIGKDTPFFTTKRGNRVNQYTVEDSFRRIRQEAAVRRDDGSRYQPRLHDLRHTFAVHRLTAWYRQNKDVQQLLPQLSVYLGHVHLAATQIYLTMTSELLNEANQRFEQYTAKTLE
jgi:site-specific recombinase XerD